MRANENISPSTKEHIVSGYNSTDLKMITYLDDLINGDDVDDSKYYGYILFWHTQTYYYG